MPILSSLVAQDMVRQRIQFCHEAVVQDWGTTVKLGYVTNYLIDRWLVNVFTVTPVVSYGRWTVDELTGTVKPFDDNAHIIQSRKDAGSSCSTPDWWGTSTP